MKNTIKVFLATSALFFAGAAAAQQPSLSSVYVGGTIIDGTETIEQAGARFFQLILETASGKKSKSEEFGYGDDEFAPWTIGATM